MTGLGRCGGVTEDKPLFEHDYARLIHAGISNHPRVAYQTTEEATKRWESEVAEPWWLEMRERAGRDGLQIECFRGGDAQLYSIGVEPLIAAAKLVRADGRAYTQRWVMEEHQLAEIAGDWGQTLQAARERHPYDFAFEQERESARSAALRRREFDPTSLQSSRRLLGRGHALRYFLLRSAVTGVIAATVISILPQLIGK